MNVRTATYTPILPISLAMVSSLIYRGVSSSSMFSFSSAMPDLVLTPTAQIIAVPYPVTTKVFASKNGLGLCSKVSAPTGNFSIYSGSPVSPLSSHAKSVPSMSTQSAGILIPLSSLITSPTTRY
jgi:hypothetical protein